MSGYECVLRGCVCVCLQSCTTTLNGNKGLGMGVEYGGAEGLRPPPPWRTYSFYKFINMRYVLDPPSNLQIVHVHSNDEAK